MLLHEYNRQALMVERHVLLEYYDRQSCNSLALAKCVCT